MFNEICINEEMLPKYTYIYIYIYIYILSLNAFAKRYLDQCSFVFYGQKNKK